MPRTGKEFVAQLKSQLTVLAAEVDAGFPANSELTIDADGVPHLKKQPAGSQPAGLAAFESEVQARVIPARRLSLTICRGTPPMDASMLTCAAIQSGSDCVQVACAKT